MLVRAFALVALGCGLAAAQPAGLFEDHIDIGDTPKQGSVEFNRSNQEYRITGGGANIWFATDAFQFLYKKLSGDFVLTATVKFEGAGAVAHRKAVLMVRQTLEAGSAYADAAVHGDGLTSLQYRPTAGALTQEVRATETGPSKLRLERRGDQITIYTGDAMKPVGPVTLSLKDPVYVGLGVCSHDANVLETAVFSDVTLSKPK